MPYAGVVLHKQNKCIDLFKAVGAIDKEHAVTLEKINNKRDSIFDKMLSIGLFNECEHGLFYMDTDIAEKLKENRSGFHLWRLEKG
jgi:hypothetical protein